MPTKYLSPEQVASMHSKTRKAVVDILNDEKRRKAIFPHAYKEGEGKRGLWRIPEKEAIAWQPRLYPIKPKEVVDNI